MLSEISQTEKDSYHTIFHSHVESKNQSRWTNKPKQKQLIDTESELLAGRREGLGRQAQRAKGLSSTNCQLGNESQGRKVQYRGTSQ